MTFLKLEIAAILSTVILITRVAPQLVNVPISLKVAHFAFVGLFSVIGVAGFHLLGLILWHHQAFTTAFSNPNPFCVSALSLQYVGYGFAVAGIILCIAALRLGAFRNWARRAVIYLALPYSILYPGIMATFTDELRSQGNFHFSYIVTAILSILALGAMLFYSSKSLKKMFCLPVIRGSTISNAGSGPSGRLD